MNAIRNGIAGALRWLADKTAVVPKSEPGAPKTLGELQREYSDLLSCGEDATRIAAARKAVSDAAGNEAK